MNILTNASFPIGGTAMVPSGSNRVAVVMVAVENHSSAIEQVEISGVQVVPAETRWDGAGNGRTTAIAVLPEADFPASEFTFDSVTIGGATVTADTNRGRIYVVENVAQTILDSDSATFSSTTTTADLPLQTEASGMAFSSCFVTSAEGNATAPTGYTIDASQTLVGWVHFANNSSTTVDVDSDTVWTIGSERSGGTLFVSLEPAAATTPGIPATILENADGTLSTGTAVTRTITRVNDSAELFTGSQTSDATTGELPEIDLSGTDAEVNQDLNDEVVLDTVPASGVVSTTVRRTVGDLGA